jgi:hypothetical protein
LLDCLVERLDDKSLVRGKQGLLEVACSCEVVVERALADAEAPAESIDPDTIRAVIRNGSQAGLNPVGSGRHAVERTIRYGMEA